MIKTEEKNLDKVKNRGALNYLVIEYLKTLDFNNSNEKQKLIQKVS